MKWLGLTGGLATGKSTVSRIFLESGIPVIDADRVAHEVVERGSPGLKAVTDLFGKEILNSTGELDRPKLAKKVFADPTSLKKLESIIHPLVQAEVGRQRKWLQDQGTELAIYDVPLLFEKKLESQFFATIVVSCTEELQIQRIKKREKWNDEEIKNRLKSQIPIAEKVKRAQYELKNDKSIEFLKKQVADLIKVLKE